jgi:ankyrin repeat protein
MHLATKLGNAGVKILYALLKSGPGAALVNTASPILKEGDECYTPLHFSAMLGSSVCTWVLLKAGADAMLRTTSGKTPLFIAVQNEYVSVVEELLKDAGGVASINMPGTRERITPLHVAASFGLWEIVQLLLEHGADPMRCLADGSTARQLASRKGHREVVSLLRKAEASVDVSRGECIYACLLASF